MAFDVNDLADHRLGRIFALRQPSLGDGVCHGPFGRFFASLVVSEEIRDQRAGASQPHFAGARRENRVRRVGILLCD